MRMVKQIYLVRHGETAWSLTGRHTGRTDLTLTEKGERQALGLGERLRQVAFTHVFTSPLRRARQTCDLAGYGAMSQVAPDSHEWDYGAYEGLTTAAIHEQQPGWNVFQDGCPAGESVEQISQRADRVFANLRMLDGTVALFSHGHFIRALAVRWIGLPLREGQHFALDTGSISILGYELHSAEIPVISIWNSNT